MTQEQITPLRESYNARFDRLALSVKPEVLAPAAFWYDHFMNIIMIANIVKEKSCTRLVKVVCLQDMHHMILISKCCGASLDGGIGIMPLHAKLPSCFGGAIDNSDFLPGVALSVCQCR